MSELQFHELVKQMRSAQKEYFKTRDREVLKKSKSLESQVDYALQMILGERLI